ncbi:MAG: SPOR domain-containing protein [Sphingomonadales bacterium]
MSKAGKSALAATMGLCAVMMAHEAVADMSKALGAYERGDYPAAAREWLSHAAQGNAEALFNLGQLYRQGLGVERDAGRAEKYYLRAARRGHVRAQSNLGTMLFFKNPAPDYENALTWWRVAAKAREPQARYMLGVVHLNGEVVPRDLVRGYALLTLAAAAGVEKAAQARKAVRESLDQKTRIAAEALALEIDPRAQLSALEPGPEPHPQPAPSADQVPVGEPAGFRIQLGALGSKAMAWETWDRLVKRHGDLLTRLAAGVEIFDRGPGHQPLYRLRAGPFPNKDAAARRCEALASHGAGCFVVPPSR